MVIPANKDIVVPVPVRLDRPTRVSPPLPGVEQVVIDMIIRRADSPDLVARDRHPRRARVMVDEYLCRVQLEFPVKANILAVVVKQVPVEVEGADIYHLDPQGATRTEDQVVVPPAVDLCAVGLQRIIVHVLDPVVVNVQILIELGPSQTLLGRGFPACPAHAADSVPMVVDVIIVDLVATARPLDLDTAHIPPAAALVGGPQAEGNGEE